MEYLPSLQGRCGTCGFLANRETPAATGEMFHEVSNAQRVTGDVRRWITHSAGPKTSLDDLQSDELELYCFVGEADLEREIRHLVDDPTKEPDRQTFQALFIKDRSCAEWIPYQPSYSPKEHRARRDREREREYEQSVRRATWEREDRRDERAAQDRTIGILVAGAFGIGGAAVGALIVVLS